MRPRGPAAPHSASRLPPAADRLERRATAAQVEAFLRSHPDFELAPRDATSAFAGALDADGCLRLSPARHGCDGFFG